MLKIATEYVGFSDIHGQKHLHFSGTSVTKHLQEQLWGLYGKQVDIFIKRHHDPRSAPQNKYLWGVVYPTIAADTGHTVEELHEEFKLMFLPIRKELVNKLTGEVRETIIGGSTTELSTVEMNEYIEKICVLAAEMGIYVPKPNEVIV